MKRLLSIMLCLSMVWGLCLPTHATTNSDAAKPETQQQAGQTQQGGAQAPQERTLTPPPTTMAEAYVVMDAETGQVLLSKNKDQKEFPASITKIMTAGLALEYLKPGEGYTVTAQDCFPEEYVFSSGSWAAIDVGENVKIQDLLSATMILSANDAANMLAGATAAKAQRTVTLGDGTVSYTEGFMEMVQEKLAEIGAVNTHFVNPHGLHNQEHYTTAYDMALIARYALSVEGFEEFFSATEYYMEPTNKQPQRRHWARSGDGMMEPTNKYYYEGTTGVKLGWTTEAHHTGVSVCERNGRKLIAVVLNCNGEQLKSYVSQVDMANLFSYCFDNFQLVTFTPQELAQRTVPLYDIEGEGHQLIGKTRLEVEGDFLLLLHWNYKKKDIRITSDVPGRYYQSLYPNDASKPATLTFTVTAKGAEEYMEPVMGQLKLTPVTTTKADEEARKKAEFQLVLDQVVSTGKTVLWVLGGLVVLLVALRIYNHQRYKKLRAQRQAAQRRRRKVRRQ